MEADCEEVGKMAVCLFYLSREANAANLPEVAKVINQAITGVIALGVERYQAHLREALTRNSNDESAFIESFCRVNDEAVRFGIREIFYRQEGGL